MIKEQSLSTIGGTNPVSANDSIIGQQSSALVRRPSNGQTNNNGQVAQEILQKSKKPSSPAINSKKASKIKKQSNLVITDLKSLPSGVQPAQLLNSANSDSILADGGSISNNNAKTYKANNDIGSSVAAEEGGSRISKPGINSSNRYSKSPKKKTSYLKQQSTANQEQNIKIQPNVQPYLQSKIPRHGNNLYLQNSMSVANIVSNPYRSSSDNQQNSGPNYLSNSPGGSGVSSSLKKKIKRDFSKEYIPGVPNYIGVNRNNNQSKLGPYDSSNQIQPLQNKY